MTTTAAAQLLQLEHPQLQEHQVWYNDQQHLLIVDSVVIDCTPSEYDVLLLLLRAAGEPVSFARLAYRDTHRWYRRAHHCTAHGSRDRLPRHFRHHGVRAHLSHRCDRGRFNDQFSRRDR